MLVAIGVFVAGAGVVGLHYASAHGWDQPVSPGQGATEPPTTSIPTDQVETTAASLPTVDTAEPAKDDKKPETKLSDAKPSDAKPEPKAPVLSMPPARTWKPKPKPADTQAPGSDPFATQQ